MPNKFKTSLAEAAPQSLLDEWHPTKNGELTPNDIGSGSSKKVWWLGKCGHEWETTPPNRYHQGRISKCPYCSNRKVSLTNNLAYMSPGIAAEWNYERNGAVTPERVIYKSSTKYWWRCPRNPAHEWEASPNDRHRFGCPFCFSRVTKPHIHLYSELLTIFPNIKIHKKVNGLEFDLYIPNLQLAIEFDGRYWHRNKFDKDLKKNKAANELDIQIIRLRGKPLKKISDIDQIISGTDVSTDLLTWGNR